MHSMTLLSMRDIGHIASACALADYRSLLSYERLQQQRIESHRHA
jgi:hypothetical protein